MKLYAKPSFDLIAVYPDGSRKDLAWPENIPLPLMGDTFTLDDELWMIDDAEWAYKAGPGGVAVSYTIYLEEDDAVESSAVGAVHQRRPR